MTFTKEEIANMGKEVEEDMSDLDDIEDDEEEVNRKAEMDSDSDDVYGCKKGYNSNVWFNFFFNLY